MFLYLNLFFKNRKYEGKYNLNNKKFHPSNSASTHTPKLENFLKSRNIKI